MPAFELGRLVFRLGNVLPEHTVDLGLVAFSSLRMALEPGQEIGIIGIQADCDGFLARPKQTTADRPGPVQDLLDIGRPGMLMRAREIAGPSVQEAAGKFGLKDSAKTTAGEKLLALEAGHRGPGQTTLQKAVSAHPRPLIAFYTAEAPKRGDRGEDFRTVNDAVDQVRRGEQKHQNVLKGTRYIWLRNPDTLSERQRATLDRLPTHHLKTARAYQMRLAFQELYRQDSPQQAAQYLKR